MFSKSSAFLRIFNRRLSYRAIFLDDVGQMKREAKAALADLKRFCHADNTSIFYSQKSGVVDPLAMAIAEGRREVWLRLQHYLTLDENTLLKLKEDNNDD